MFPHTITVFVFDEDSQTYSREVIEGVYYTSDMTIRHSGSVREESVGATVVIPKSLMNNSIRKGCFIVKGNVPEISTMSELEQYDEKIEVTSVSVHDAGWDIDNMVVHGI